MKLLIRNGTLVMPWGSLQRDVVCDDGVVEELVLPGDYGQLGRFDDVIEARGLLVFPGFIDPHVHTREPGDVEKEDFAHATLAAACGGITTICEMPNAVPPVLNAEILKQRVTERMDRSHVDYSSWALMLAASSREDILELVALGVIGFKLFIPFGYNDIESRLVPVANAHDGTRFAAPPTSQDLRRLFAIAGETDTVVGIHCEDPELFRDSGYLDAATGGYESLLSSRPEAAEAVAIARCIEIARTTKCRIHIVHMSTARGARLVAEAKSDGIRVTAETCPHYLRLGPEDYADYGSAMKVVPPIRGGIHRDALREAMRKGIIDSIGSDHAPHTPQEKSKGLAAAPGGIPGAQVLAPLMIDLVCTSANQ